MARSSPSVKSAARTDGIKERSGLAVAGGVNAVSQSISTTKERAGQHSTATAIGAGVVVGVVATPVALAALSGAGFSAGGVGAGTLASAWQSTYGTGYMFSLLQGCGATSSIGMAAPVGVGATTGWAVSQNLNLRKYKADLERLDEVMKDCLDVLEDARKEATRDIEKEKEIVNGLTDLLEKVKKETMDLENDIHYRNGVFIHEFKKNETAIKARADSGDEQCKDLRKIRNCVAHKKKYYVSKKNLQRLRKLRSAL